MKLKDMLVPFCMWNADLVTGVSPTLKTYQVFGGKLILLIKKSFIFSNVKILNVISNVKILFKGEKF